MIKDTMTGSPLTLKLNGGLVFFNVSKKRVVPQTNYLHTESLLLVKGEGQQPDNYSHLKSKDSESACPVVEISCATGNTGLCNQYLCPAYFHNLSKAA